MILEHIFLCKMKNIYTIDCFEINYLSQIFLICIEYSTRTVLIYTHTDHICPRSEILPKSTSESKKFQQNSLGNSLLDKQLIISCACECVFIHSLECYQIPIYSVLSTYIYDISDNQSEWNVWLCLVSFHLVSIEMSIGSFMGDIFSGAVLKENNLGFI